MDFNKVYCVAERELLLLYDNFHDGFSILINVGARFVLYIKDLFEIRLFRMEYALGKC